MLSGSSRARYDAPATAWASSRDEVVVESIDSDDFPTNLTAVQKHEVKKVRGEFAQGIKLSNKVLGGVLDFGEWRECANNILRNASSHPSTAVPPKNWKLTPEIIRALQQECGKPLIARVSSIHDMISTLLSADLNVQQKNCDTIAINASLATIISNITACRREYRTLIQALDKANQAMVVSDILDNIKSKLSGLAAFNNSFAPANPAQPPKNLNDEQIILVNRHILNSVLDEDVSPLKALLQNVYDSYSLRDNASPPPSHPKRVLRGLSESFDNGELRISSDEIPGEVVACKRFGAYFLGRACRHAYLNRVVYQRFHLWKHLASIGGIMPTLRGIKEQADEQRRAEESMEEVVRLQRQLSHAHRDIYELSRVSEDKSVLLAERALNRELTASNAELHERMQMLQMNLLEMARVPASERKRLVNDVLLERENEVLRARKECRVLKEQIEALNQALRPSASETPKRNGIREATHDTDSIELSKPEAKRIILHEIKKLREAQVKSTKENNKLQNEIEKYRQQASGLQVLQDRYNDIKMKYSHLQRLLLEKLGKKAMDTIMREVEDALMSY